LRRYSTGAQPRRSAAQRLAIGDGLIVGTCISSPGVAEDTPFRPARATAARVDFGVTVLTGGFDRPYAFGLAMALNAQGIALDVIGNQDIESPEMHATPRLNFLIFYPNSFPKVGLPKKLLRVLVFYIKLFRYAATTNTKIFHILWNNKIPAFDRTLLMLYYKALGKKVVLTAHNVNAGKRDGNDSFLNRLTLKIQYRLADHIFVHTERMRAEFHEQFGIDSRKLTVIPFGINNSVPHTVLTPAEAKQRLGLEPGTKTVLFFGAIRPYKGLEHLVSAFLRLAERHAEYRLVIVGAAKKGCEDYLTKIQQQIAGHPAGAQVIQRTHFVPDCDTELYFKAADVVALPYLEIFQSGVLFLSFSFGVPVVASDIGSFRDDVIEGWNGFLYDLNQPEALAQAIEKCFASDLYRELESRRDAIRTAAEQAHSWETVGQATRSIYEQLLAEEHARIKN
jgi:glycosyltransferase involved in cell wall biosynthesis